MMARSRRNVSADRLRHLLDTLEPRVLLSSNWPIGTVALSSAANLSVAVYDSSGQVVRTLMRAEPKPAGNVAINWDGKDDFGNVLPNADYQWRAVAGNVSGIDDGSV